MLAATAGACAALPVAVPGLAIADLVRGRGRLPSVRSYLFVLQYLINDTVEIVLAPIYWLRAGLGTSLGSPASIDRHQQLQSWSVDLLEKRAAQLLGLRVELPEADQAALAPGPVIVISRHVSLFDATLPGLLYQRLGYRIRGIIMAELLTDPGFDLLYSRLGSVFIPRDDGKQATSLVKQMTADANDGTAFVIFPEGRLFRASVRERALARLDQSDPERAKRLGGLQHLLPPRPGGLLTLLAALPQADVVLVDHRGLDRFPTVADLLRSAPVSEPIRVSVRRIPRSEIPDAGADQIRWLDDLWLNLDRELAQDRALSGP